MTHLTYISISVVIDPGSNTTLVVNVTEGDGLTVNCSIETNKPSWSRRDGAEVQTETRIIDGVLLYIKNASIADTGVYECRHGKDQHTVWIQVLGRSSTSTNTETYSASKILLTLYNRDIAMVSDTGNFQNNSAEKFSISKWPRNALFII